MAERYRQRGLLATQIFALRLFVFNLQNFPLPQ